MENKQGSGHCSRRGRVNRVQKFREAALMAKAELARRAVVSESIVDRIEAGHDCRLETKRMILVVLRLPTELGGKLLPGDNVATWRGAGGQRWPVCCATR